MITWKATIMLISKMFEKSQKEIAEKLGVSPSTLSKIKKGNQASMFDADDIFQKVFSNENKESFASKYKSTDSESLDALKDIIERHFSNNKFNIKEDMMDVWEEKDYKTFVITLLNRTRRPVLNKKPTIHTANTYKEVFLQETSLGKTYHIFQEEAEKYEIEDFMSVNTTTIMHDKWVTQPENFILEMRNKILIPFEKDIFIDHTSSYAKLVLKIEAFTNTLNNYLMYLGSNMVPAVSRSNSKNAVDYMLPISHNLKYSGDVEEYQNKLQFLWKEIRDYVREEFIRFLNKDNEQENIYSKS